jgi:hypothetical protein
VPVHDLDGLVDKDPAEEGKRTHDRRQHALVVERNDGQVVNLGKKSSELNGSML